MRCTAAGTSTVTVLVERVPARSWPRLRTGHGGKGERHYDWAMFGLLADDTPDGPRPLGELASVATTRCTGPSGDAATNTGPRPVTGDGTR
ncbi:hypothetical protein ACFLIM_38715 [Nonomuraea sp. M3C6]|uniref:Transposase n=1 Tax=Nonomuraea marmarensis TaxID=3351344 RepID=A0ABW7AP41_9ACTN